MMMSKMLTWLCRVLESVEMDDGFSSTSDDHAADDRRATGRALSFQRHGPLAPNSMLENEGPQHDQAFLLLQQGARFTPQRQPVTMC